jgi:hypothetical protein
MAFQKGQSGNPGGRPNDKPWREAIQMALKDKDPKRLRKIADSLIDLAESGDLQAMKEIGDRLDGKPAQQQIHTGADGEAVKHEHKATVEFVRPSKDS